MVVEAIGDFRAETQVPPVTPTVTFPSAADAGNEANDPMMPCPATATITSLRMLRSSLLLEGGTLPHFRKAEKEPYLEAASCAADTHQPCTCGRSGTGTFTRATGGAEMLSASRIHSSLW
jgi:hypothetical protein